MLKKFKYNGIDKPLVLFGFIWYQMELFLFWANRWFNGRKQSYQQL